MPHFGFPGGARRRLLRRDGEVPLPARGRGHGRERSDPGRGPSDAVHFLPGGVRARVRVCATGAIGFRGPALRRDRPPGLFRRDDSGRGEQLSNVVFMGMGEPLLNVPRSFADDRNPAVAVRLRALRQRVTVSTAGIVPEMLTLALTYPRQLRRFAQRLPGRSPFPPATGQPEISAEGGRRRDAADPPRAAGR